MERAQDYIDTVTAWAKIRARRSECPQAFMEHFSNRLRPMLNGADIDERPPFWADPTQTAAEIEAIAAGRAVHWLDRQYRNRSLKKAG